jgi:hypothetical protein
MITHLYIKIHTKTGLKYFGKTNRDPYSYYGSGKKWRYHINYHGKEYIKTLKVWSFEDLNECSNFAIKFSVKNNIVESQTWANLTIEDGLMGGKMHDWNNESRKLISISRKNKSWYNDGVKEYQLSQDDPLTKTLMRGRSKTSIEKQAKSITGITHSADRKCKNSESNKLTTAKKKANGTSYKHSPETIHKFISSRIRNRELNNRPE